MLDALAPQPPDALLALIKQFEADGRPDKIDLGVGVYRTGQGDTPVFEAVKKAEERLVREQTSKAYLGPEGDMGFVEALMPYLFGESAMRDGRITGMQTPGGTGAVRLALALAKKAGATRVHLGLPSWPNHAQILKDLEFETIGFDHASEADRADLDAVIDAIGSARAGDAILLHGCCHNPTGIDYTNDQWDAIAGALADSPVLPLIDIAYQGLGHGMEDDAYGLRRVLAAVPEALIAQSCDKNFGVYRDRVGACYVMAEDGEQLDAIMSNAAALARANWSMPPDHGGATVRLILGDEALTALWLDELETMRTRLNQVRARLADAGVAGSVDLRPLGRQTGLFSVLPLSKSQIETLRDEHAIYMAGSGRINVAGLHMGNIDKFVDALSKVSG